MVNTCGVQGCVVGTAKQNVTMHDFPKEVMAAFRPDAAKPLGAERHSHVCS